MSCPAPPGYFDLAAPHDAMLTGFIVALTVTWLFLLGLAPFILRREIKGLPPGPARRAFLLWYGAGQFLCLTGFLLLIYSLLWQNALSEWSTSLPALCRTPAVQAFLDQSFLIGAVLIIAFFPLVGSGVVLTEIARWRKRRLTQAAGHSK